MIEKETKTQAQLIAEAEKNQTESWEQVKANCMPCVKSTDFEESTLMLFQACNFRDCKTYPSLRTYFMASNILSKNK